MSKMKDFFDIKDRVAIITGSGNGIGEAMAAYFGQVGAKVVIADLNLDDAERVASDIEKDRGTAFPIKIDVGKEEDIKKMVAETVKKFGTIDILINNAARGGGGALPQELDIDKWREVMKINLDSVFLCCREVGKVMIEKGSGSIINFGSVEAVVARAYKDEVAYGTSKAAVLHYTKELGKSWAKYNIRVNAIAPCYADTKMGNISGNPVKMNLLKDRSPMGRPAKVEEFCGPALFLASDASSYITGHTLMVDGGWVIV